MPPPHERLGYLSHWLELRGRRYVWARLRALRRRYGMSSSPAKQRVFDCVDLLARYDCHPTFPTPGEVVGRYSVFCRELQARGAELAVHGYHHVDFRALSREAARRQFVKAAAVYREHAIAFEGFRCPYLSCAGKVYAAVPDGAFHYSSNAAIWWDVLAPADEPGGGTSGRATAIFESLSRLYRPESSQTTPAVPRMIGDLVEIPVCLPDDLQLLDGHALGAQGLRRAWTGILRRTHERGELFNLLFHPESFGQCAPGLESVLMAARSLRPSVWTARLDEISRWWREKAAFSVDRVADGAGMRLDFHCSDRATILVRGLDHLEQTRRWYEPYRALPARTVWIGADVRPFVGVAPDAPPDLAPFLQEQGYLLDTSAEASRCALFLDGRTPLNRVQLLASIENASSPLVRFWRWPAGARSALCLTGDLDALSLRDYAARVIPRR